MLGSKGLIFLSYQMIWCKGKRSIFTFLNFLHFDEPIGQVKIQSMGKNTLILHTKMANMLFIIQLLSFCEVYM